MQAQVEDFHAELGQPIGDHPRFSRPELRAALIQEEAGETIAALLAGDIVATADGLADLLYVVFGTAVEMGINIEPIFDEVHRTNMLKVGGPTRGDGKIQKPEGWQPPRIRELLLAQMVGKP
jgi:predicted HAD superfamily Cof-like phosphohydrolase